MGGVDLAATVDAAAMTDEQLDRLRRELEGVEVEIANAEKRLGNPNFVERAPEHVVEGSRRRLEELNERRRLLAAEIEASAVR